MEEEIRQRRFARMVRLEYGPNRNEWVLEFLMRELQLRPEDLYEMAGELDYDDLRIIAELNIPRLRYEPWSPMVPAPFADEDADMFNVIHSGDVLVHLPYESFSGSVERFDPRRRRRSECAGDQDDRLSHRRQEHVYPAVDHSRRGRQAGCLSG